MGRLHRLLASLGIVLGLAVVAPAPGHAEITITDFAGRRVTLPRPAERILLAEGTDLMALGLIDRDPARRIVAWNPWRIDAVTLMAWQKGHPSLSQVQSLRINSASGLPVESMLASAPDLIILHPYYLDLAQLRPLEAVGIPVAVLDITPQIRRPDPLEGLRIAAELIGHEKEFAEFAAFYRSRIARIRLRVEALPAEARPKVLIEAHAGRGTCCMSAGRGEGIGDLVEFVGGHNIGGDVIAGTIGDLSLEYIIGRAPEVYVATGGPHLASHGGLVLGVGRSAEEARETFARILARPGIAQLPAVRDGRAHGLWMSLTGPLNIVAIELLAKWIHPDRFADIDPQATLDEINRRFSAIAVTGALWVDGPRVPRRNP